MPNPLIDDRFVDFLLDDVLELPEVLRLPRYTDHSRETLEQFLDSTKRFAREVLYPLYGVLDREPPTYQQGQMKVHPRIGPIYRQMVDLGLLNAMRTPDVGGQALPYCIWVVGQIYLAAANNALNGYPGLTTGAAHLIESFGNDELKAWAVKPMLDGHWTGTMALTEPQAGSSLADLTTSATPATGKHYLIKGAKLFISGGDQDFSENIMHLTLARIPGSPAGTKGISLFAIPKRRPSANGLVPNDVHCAGAIHKIGWKGLPSVALNFGDNDDCWGWLVGEPNRGLSYMFQMMNGARISVGLFAAASASAGYQEALAYAKTRRQGRPLAARQTSDPKPTEQIPIIEHADVRRMLLRQKAIVEGSLALVTWVGRLYDVANYGKGEEQQKSKALLDLLVPVAKSFPSERGFEANTLAIQIHGGYGYSSEYPVESYWRDQKLNSLHEGTTGIQGLDLLGRKVAAQNGEALRLFLADVEAVAELATKRGLSGDLSRKVTELSHRLGEVTLRLAMTGEAERVLRHSADYLEAFSTLVIAWIWLKLATAAVGRDGDFFVGQLTAAEYWIVTEIPKAHAQLTLCSSEEDSYLRVPENGF